MSASKPTTKIGNPRSRAARSTVCVEPGDELAYSIEANIVNSNRADHAGADDPFKTFSEWNSEFDCKAYADL